MSLRYRVSNLRLLLLDVDGVLTDGRLFYLEDGERVKVFNVHDGLGIKLLQNIKVDVGIISGRESEALKNRLLELGIDKEKIFMGRVRKREILENISREYKLEFSQIGFIGDDYVDIPVMRLVGFPVAVSNAYEEVKKFASYITTVRGGEGAVREVAELILALRGIRREMLDGYR